jgi:hypothetical protein
MQIEGVIVAINAAEKKTDKFTVQTFIVETDGKYPQFYEFQLTNDRVGLVDNYLDKKATVHFDLQGRKWQKDATTAPKYFITLNCWKVEAQEVQAFVPKPQSYDQYRANDPFTSSDVAVDTADDMPF